MQEEANLPTIRLGGRPTKEESEQLGEKIVEAATELFLAEGYGATSIEAIVKRAQVSKRTFYHRFADKAALFGAVVHQIIESLRPRDHTPLFQGKDIESILRRLATMMIHAAVEPNVLAMNRLIIAEGPRFPELAEAVAKEGSGADVVKQIAHLLRREAEAGRVSLDDAEFAAAEFIQMIIAIPQRRALQMGTPMSTKQLSEWADKAVTLFLNGALRKSPI